MGCDEEEKRIVELKSLIKENEEKLNSLYKQIFKLVEGEKLFLDLINGKNIKYENDIIAYYDKRGERIIEEDYQRNIISFNYYGFWVHFKTIFGDDSSEINKFLKDMISKYMKKEGLMIRFI